MDNGCLVTILWGVATWVALALCFLALWRWGT